MSGSARESADEVASVSDGICPLCGAGEARLAAEGARHRRCADCDLTFLRPELRLGPAAERAHYDRHENFPDEPGYRAFVRPAVEAVLAATAPGAAGIDYGCGAGSAAAALLRESGRSVALYDPYFHPDPAPLAARYAFAIATETAEHFYRPSAEFARLRDLLRPGGALVVMTELREPGRDFASWHYVRDPTHVAFYSRRTMGWIARRHGFDGGAEILSSRLCVLRA